MSGVGIRIPDLPPVFITDAEFNSMDIHRIAVNLDVAVSGRQIKHRAGGRIGYAVSFLGPNDAIGAGEHGDHIAGIFQESTDFSAGIITYPLIRGPAVVTERYDACMAEDECQFAAVVFKNSAEPILYGLGIQASA